MNEQKSMKRWFEPLDPEMLSWRRGWVIEEAVQRYWDALKETDEDIPLGSEDIELLREYTRDPAYEVRAAAVKILCDYGPISWEDFETWMLDPDEHVREAIVFLVDFDMVAVGELCASDKPRCAAVLADAVEKRADSTAAYRLMRLSNEDREWLEATWPQVERLMDLGNPKIYMWLTCGYIEDALQDYNLGPDDPLVHSWLVGDSVQRKLSLLAVGVWMGLDKARLRDITEALAKDSDEAIAWIAKATLHKHIPQTELGMGYYEVVRKWLDAKSLRNSDASA